MVLHPKLDFRSLYKKRLMKANTNNPTFPNTPAAEPSPLSTAAMENLKDNSQQPIGDEVGDKSPGMFDLDTNLPAIQKPRLEDTVKRLFSEEHFHHILTDHLLFQRFSIFVNKYQPQYVPTLIRYMDMLKATKAIEYANAMALRNVWSDRLEFQKVHQFTAATMDHVLEESTAQDLETLCNEVLSAFITQTLVSTVYDCVVRDITGNTVPAMSDLLGGLAEVFCLTDPSLEDNPIIFASEEFYYTTRYGMSYAINRNCRFLQGPETDKKTTSRMSQALKEGRESYETLLNYRRDGTPFVNLLMMAPLLDDMGHVKYFIGAQADVTGLIEKGRGIESFRSLLQHKGETTQSPFRQHPPPASDSPKPLELLKQLSQMLSRDEAEVVKQNARDPESLLRGSSSNHCISGSFSSPISQNHNDSTPARRTRITIGAELSDQDATTYIQNSLSTDSKNGPISSSLVTNTATLPGPYKHYLLVRPHPSHQIVFLSPSLRIPGLLRSKFFDKIGGPASTISALESALIDGVRCTAKILWLPKANGNNEGRPRWIRCTPLLGIDDKIGVWMIVVIPVKSTNQESYDSPYSNQAQGPPESPSSHKSQNSQSSDHISKSIGSTEQKDLIEFSVSPTSITGLRKRPEALGLGIRVPEIWSAHGSPMLSPVDGDLYADYLKHATPYGPLPVPPKIAGDGLDSGTASFDSQSQMI